MKKSKKFQPPKDLSNRAKKLFLHYVPTQVKSPARIELLVTGLMALDQARKARELYVSEGIVVTTEWSGVIHAHPSIKLEKEARAYFLRAMKALGLDHEPPLMNRDDSGKSDVIPGFENIPVFELDI